MASRTTSGEDYNLSDPANSFVDVVRGVLLQPATFSGVFHVREAFSVLWFSP